MESTRVTTRLPISRDKMGGYGVDMGAGRLLGAFTVLIPILAMAGVLLLLYGVVPFVSSHAIPTF